MGKRNVKIKAKSAVYRHYRPFSMDAHRGVAAVFFLSASDLGRCGAFMDCRIDGGFSGNTEKMEKTVIIKK